MPFQFYCPNGHLLQANEDQIGQNCVCPHCQVQIVIPTPAGYVPSQPQPNPQGTSISSTPNIGQPEVSTFNFSSDAPNKKPAQQQAAPGEPGFELKKKSKKFNFEKAQNEDAAFPRELMGKTDLGDPDKDNILHCLCPSGHSLNIDRNMLGQQAMCPYCQKTFVIKLERTVEYIKKRQRTEDLETTKLTKTLLQWSIIGGVLALIFIIVMIALMMGR